MTSSRQHQRGDTDQIVLLRSGHIEIVDPVAVLARDAQVTWQALGLGAWLWSAGHGARFCARRDLVSRRGATADDVRAAVRCLRDSGYLRTRKSADEPTMWCVSPIPLKAEKWAVILTFLAAKKDIIRPVLIEGSYNYITSEILEYTRTSPESDEADAGQAELSGMEVAGPKGWTSAEWQVFSAWREFRSRALAKRRGPPMQPTAKRRAAIRARLREGYTADQLIEAIRGCLSNRRNVVNGYTDIELICRDQGKVEQYRAWLEAHQDDGGDPWEQELAGWKDRGDE